jgi:YHS domain-containing protein
MSQWTRCGGLIVLAAVCVTEAKAGQMPAAPATAAQPRGAAAVSRVPAVDLVCMVNDRFMGVKQIPVEVEGRTYYGCCPMCKSRLAQDKTVREAVDPVSGKTVDKATAVVAKRADDSVLYFESATTLARYNKQKPAAPPSK